MFETVPAEQETDVLWKAAGGKPGIRKRRRVVMRVAGWSVLAMSLLMAWASLAPAAAKSAGKGNARPAIAADIQPAALWDGRNEVEFHAADFPKMVKAADAKFLI